MVAKVYTTGFRRRNRLIAALVTMAAGVAPFMVTLAVLQFWSSPPPYAAGLLTVATFVAAGLAAWYSRGTLALLGNYGLKQRLGKLAEAELSSSIQQAGAAFVGFSPGDKLRIWDGETDRDVGFLAVENNTLVYVGDEYKWSLPRQQIDQVELAASSSGIRRIIVRWHAPREGGRAFSITCREANTLEGVGLVNLRLYEAVRDWVWSDTRPARQNTLRWGYPPTDVSGGWAIDQPLSGSCATVLAMTVIVVLTIWGVSGSLLAMGDYYGAILWAGLLAVVGAVFTAYLLSYLHSWHAAKSRPRRGAH